VTAATLAARARAASGESLIANALTRLGHAIARGERHRADASSQQQETAWFFDEITATRIGRSAALAFDAVARAWPDAAARRFAQTTAAGVRGLVPAQRIRVAGIWMFSAALTDAALTPLDPRPASAARWVMWGAVLAIGAVASAWPEPTAAAWAEWRRRWSRSPQNT
jgi:hypothetical protein